LEFPEFEPPLGKTSILVFVLALFLDPDVWLPVTFLALLYAPITVMECGLAFN